MYDYRPRGNVHIFDASWSDRDLHDEALQWCEREFGEGARNPTYDTRGVIPQDERWLWFNRGARIIIWSEQDAFAFRLRWC